MKNKDEKYYCPMKCEGDKVYDQPGVCPVCNMYLVPVGSDGHKHGHHHHGMHNLEHGTEAHNHKEQTHEHTHHSHTGGSEKYYCPMRCEGDKTYNEPGNCPVCGMHLLTLTLS